ncbi:hypothetical protein TNIN_446621 [Trichonephila inaurata madagascariensis]|uniref:Uncharacterized protein n=1 Tax=Trichonephila inaurata madagascariensis TaxID=2747483 RepID=A0A8X7BU13_9ARAC|nr:hypothetical protein TNIN_446621 [Trichonephila inaurata madagascariensis]
MHLLQNSSPKLLYVNKTTLSKKIEKTKVEDVAVDSEELKRLHQLFKEPDLYSSAYDAPTQKALRGFNYCGKASISKRFMPFKSNIKCREILIP